MIRVWVVAAAVASWTVQEWRLGSEILEVEARHAGFVQTLTEENNRLLKESNERLLQAQRRVAKLGAVAADNRDAVARLRNTPASSCSSPETGAVVPSPERELLGECAQALAEMADQADRHVIDLQRLTDQGP